MKQLQGVQRLKYYGYFACLISCSSLMVGCFNASDSTSSSSSEPTAKVSSYTEDNVSPLIARDWMLVAFANYARSDLINNKAQMNFIDDGQIYADMGCNQLGGSFIDTDDGAVTFSNISSTRMACMDISGQLEQDFVTQLERITHYRVESHQLLLLSDDGVVMEFVAADWD